MMLRRCFHHYNSFSKPYYALISDKNHTNGRNESCLLDIVDKNRIVKAALTSIWVVKTRSVESSISWYSKILIQIFPCIPCIATHHFSLKVFFNQLSNRFVNFNIIKICELLLNLITNVESKYRLYLAPAVFIIYVYSYEKLFIGTA